jgi:hypothetical protein
MTKPSSSQVTSEKVQQLVATSEAASRQPSLRAQWLPSVASYSAPSAAHASSWPASHVKASTAATAQQSSRTAMFAPPVLVRNSHSPHEEGLTLRLLDVLPFALFAGPPCVQV